MKKTGYIAPFVFIVASMQLLVSAPVNANIDLIEKLDLDKDGQITIKEAVADPAVLASFGKIDTDGNGKISLIELAKVRVVLVKEKNMSKS
ncbi:MAG: Ca2+-binding EF-hand superfamily protein [Paraglaciecola sp.]|jgi:Ca2+-binding EF-hand superfamily protein